MRKLVYYVACTVDRFIARLDGSFDFYLTEGEHLADLVDLFPETVPGHLRAIVGVTRFNQQFDAVLMGRGTYEVGLKEGITSPYPHLKQYLFSRSIKQSPNTEVKLISGDAAETVRSLKQMPGKDIWLCGGGELATTLFSEIDELILKVNPILLGEGIPLFSGPIVESALEITYSKLYSNGFMLLQYRVKHQNNA